MIHELAVVVTVEAAEATFDWSSVVSAILSYIINLKLIVLQLIIRRKLGKKLLKRMVLQAV